MLSREEIIAALEGWNRAWDAHDLDGVMNLFHDDIIFNNWTEGKAHGKEALRKAWAPWFQNNGGFRFIEEDLFIDEMQQKVLYQWSLEWPSSEAGFEGLPEKRRGVDVIYFKEGKIFRKTTFIKTAVEINGRRMQLSPLRGR